MNNLEKKRIIMQLTFDYTKEEDNKYAIELLNNNQELYTIANKGVYGKIKYLISEKVDNLGNLKFIMSDGSLNLERDRAKLIYTISFNEQYLDYYKVLLKDLFANFTKDKDKLLTVNTIDVIIMKNPDAWQMIFNEHINEFLDGNFRNYTMDNVAKKYDKVIDEHLTFKA